MSSFRSGIWVSLICVGLSACAGDRGPQGVPGTPATPGAAAYGELYLAGNAVATSLPVQNAYVQIVSGWAAGGSSGMTPQPGASNIDTESRQRITCAH